MTRSTPEIATERLVLRAFREDDVAPLHVALSDPDVTRYWSSAPNATIEETRAYLLEGTGPGWRWWIIARRDDDVALGWVSVGARRQGGVSEIGYILTPAAHGQGLAREAVAAVIDHLFIVDGDRRVMADTDPDNAGSNVLLERLGFTLEGRLRGEWDTHIGVRDSLIWGLLKDEWRR